MIHLSTMSVSRLRPSILDIGCSLSLSTLIPRYHTLRHQRHPLHCLRSPHAHFYSTRPASRALLPRLARGVAKIYNLPLPILRVLVPTAERKGLRDQSRNFASQRLVTDESLKAANDSQRALRRSLGGENEVDWMKNIAQTETSDEAAAKIQARLKTQEEYFQDLFRIGDDDEENVVKGRRYYDSVPHAPDVKPNFASGQITDVPMPRDNFENENNHTNENPQTDQKDTRGARPTQPTPEATLLKTWRKLKKKWRKTMGAKYMSKTLVQSENKGLGTATKAWFEKLEKQHRKRFKTSLGRKVQPIVELIHLERQQAKLELELSNVSQELDEGYDFEAKTAELETIKAIYDDVRRDVDNQRQEKRDEEREKLRIIGMAQGHRQVNIHKAEEWLTKDVMPAENERQVKLRISKILKTEAKMDEIKEKEKEALEKGEILDLEGNPDLRDPVISKTVIKNGKPVVSNISVLRKAKRREKRQSTKIRRAARMEKHREEVEAIIEENPKLQPREALTAIHLKGEFKKQRKKAERKARERIGNDEEEPITSPITKEELDPSDWEDIERMERIVKLRQEKHVGSSFEECAARQEDPFPGGMDFGPKVAEIAESWEEKDRERGSRESEDKHDTPIERFIQNPMPPSRRAQEELFRKPLIEGPLPLFDAVFGEKETTWEEIKKKDSVYHKKTKPKCQRRGWISVAGIGTGTDTDTSRESEPRWAIRRVWAEDAPVRPSEPRWAIRRVWAEDAPARPMFRRGNTRTRIISLLER